MQESLILEKYQMPATLQKTQLFSSSLSLWPTVLGSQDEISQIEHLILYV